MKRHESYHERPRSQERHFLGFHQSLSWQSRPMAEGAVVGQWSRLRPLPAGTWTAPRWGVLTRRGPKAPHPPKKVPRGVTLSRGKRRPPSCRNSRGPTGSTREDLRETCFPRTVLGQILGDFARLIPSAARLERRERLSPVFGSNVGHGLRAHRCLRRRRAGTSPGLQTPQLPRRRAPGPPPADPGRAHAPSGPRRGRLDRRVSPGGLPRKMWRENGASPRKALEKSRDEHWENAEGYSPGRNSYPIFLFRGPDTCRHQSRRLFSE